MSPDSCYLLGSPIGNSSTLSSAIDQKVSALKLMGKRLSLFSLHDSMLLLRPPFPFHVSCSSFILPHCFMWTLSRSMMLFCALCCYRSFELFVVAGFVASSVGWFGISFRSAACPFMLPLFGCCFSWSRYPHPIQLYCYLYISVL